jgi:NADH-quinone oxidoreductase subunit K
MGEYLLLSALLFSIGAYGVLARKNLIILLMSLELMLNGVNIALITFALKHAAVTPSPHGHVFVLIVMAVAAAEVAVGLAIVIAMFRLRQTVDTDQMTDLRG